MKPFSDLEVWFVTGTTHHYGDASLRRVTEQSGQIAAALASSVEIPLSVVPKPVVKTPESIAEVCLEANAAANCVGVIAWMHTFSPAKMWIGGLRSLRSLFCTCIPSSTVSSRGRTIDMDFMNLNQSAHGDREFAFMETRMGMARKNGVGHWSEPWVLARIGGWARAAAGWHEAQRLKVARFGDNMREVAVTEGDKVEA